MLRIILKQAQCRALSDRSRHKITSTFSTKARIFLPNAQKGFVLFKSIALVGKMYQKKYRTHGYINNPQSPFIDPIKNDKKCDKLPPSDHGGPKMKFTDFQHNC